MKNQLTFNSTRLTQLMRAAVCLTLTFAVGTTTMQAQTPTEVESPTMGEESISGDTTRISLGNTRLIIINDDESIMAMEDTSYLPDDEPERYGDDADEMTTWAGLDIGVSGFLSPKGSLSLGKDLQSWELDYAKSISVSFNPIEKKIPLYKNYIGINTGLGFEFNNYAFKNDVTLSVTPDTVINMLDSVVNYDKNKLKVSYLTIPLMLEFNTSKYREKSVHLAVGLIGGVRLSSKWKYKHETEEETVKNKVKSQYHINAFKYSAAVRVGYGGFTLFANYGLSSMFEKGKGPELYPFNAGLTLNF